MATAGRLYVGKQLFLGTFTHPPMKEAMLFCTNDLLPELTNKLDGEKFTLTFIGPVKERDKIKNEDVYYTGRISNVSEFLANATLCINPIIYGSGTCLKVLEYSAMKKATVSTKKGAEGLCMGDGEHIVISDRNSFAELIIALLNNPIKRQWIAENAYNFVSKHYTCCLLYTSPSPRD